MEEITVMKPPEGGYALGPAQTPIGAGRGSYALNTEADTGAPADPPDTALPGLRTGAYPFSRRLLGLGDQGALDPLLGRGGSYLDVHPGSYLSDK
ncbi:MAG TPA: hypothetical protein VNL71_00265 [Chloroflexota bacterium]|nr:hypothetical protein [Chloroflexota bacterium]